MGSYPEYHSHTVRHNNAPHTHPQTQRKTHKHNKHTQPHTILATIANNPTLNSNPSRGRSGVHLGELDEECALAGHDAIAGADAREDAVAAAQHAAAPRHKRPDLPAKSTDYSLSLSRSFTAAILVAT